MEGSIYNNISKEINFQLPEINFDSDSDGIDDTQPIKPYIRPSAEILFGNEDSDSEEILDILSKLPQESDIVKKNKVENGCLAIENSNKNINCELPFNNIKLISGIQHGLPVKFDEKTENNEKVVLSKFGIRDDIDLDKVLEEMDLSCYQTTFFDDVLLDSEEIKSENEVNTDNSNSELLKHLDEISKHYETLSKKNNNSNNNCSQNSVKTKKSVSLANLFDQMKQESTNKTVYIDLRSENQSCCLSNKIIKKDVANLMKGLDSEDSSDDENDNENGICDMNDLWIDNYRKSKSIQKIDNQVLNGHDKTKTKIEENKNEISVMEPIFEIENEIVTVSVNEKIDVKDVIPEHIRVKIEKIKQQEKILSTRRFLVNQLKEFIDYSDSYPALLHEEVTFETNFYELTPELIFDAECKYFNIFISLSPPVSILTNSKVPSPFSVDSAKDNFIILLSLILQSTDINSSCSLPFHVLGFQQIYYQNQLQLVLLCQSHLSLTKLRMDLKNCTLRDILAHNEESYQLLSTLPLSNILKFQPFDPLTKNNIWNWNKSSIMWHKILVNNITCPNNKKSRNMDINTSCIVIEKEFYVSLEFRKLLHVLLDRFTIAGLRLIQNKERINQLILAVRGFDAIDVIKVIQNHPVYKNKFTCTRFKENSTKELCNYFGPRLNEEHVRKLIEKSQCKNVVNELSYEISIYNSLYRSQSNDVMVFVSPMCLDIGWILNILYEKGGFLLINIIRLNLSISAGRQIGIPENEIDSFEMKNGTCHLLIIRNENPLHSLKFVLHECLAFMANNDNLQLKLETFFYMTSYSESLIDMLDIQRAFQTPEIRELSLNLSDAPYEDCEQCAFVLIISDEFTRHIAQILDQMTNLDLLAVKCFSNEIDEDHMILINSQFDICLPNLKSISDNDNPEIKMRIGVIAVRSMYVIRELEKIHNSIKIEKNLVFAYTMTTETTFRMIGSFFTSLELVCDPRRRSSLRFLPESSVKILNQKSILSQFPILYSSIETVFIAKISQSESILSKFRKLWFLLTRDGFSVIHSFLGENRKLYFVVNRVNAIFYLIQWVKCHFKDNIDEQIEFVTTPEDILVFQQQIISNFNRQPIIPMNSKINNELIFIMIKYNLLESSVEMLSNTKLFWNFLEDIKFQYIRLSVIDIDGSMIYKLRNISMLNPSGAQIQKENRYLCLVIGGSFTNLITTDLIKLKFELVKSDQQLSDYIYLNKDINQIIQCCDILFREINTTE